MPRRRGPPLPSFPTPPPPPCCCLQVKDPESIWRLPPPYTSTPPPRSTAEDVARLKETLPEEYAPLPTSLTMPLFSFPVATRGDARLSPRPRGWRRAAGTVISPSSLTSQACKRASRRPPHGK